MDDEIIVVMQKNPETGILEREYCSYRISVSGAEYIVNIFAAERGGKMYAHLKLSTPDTADWEFDAVYDYYDAELFAGELESITELDDCFNPTWELVYPLPENEAEAEAKLKRILDIHNREVNDVFEAIRDKRDEYERAES